MTIPSPGRSPKQLLPGIGLHDPLHCRQACPEFNSFYEGIGQIFPREGLFSCRPLLKQGKICDIPDSLDSRFTKLYRDASSAILQLVNQWLNFTYYSRSHAFRYGRKNTNNPALTRIELTTSALAGVQVTY